METETIVIVVREGRVESVYGSLPKNQTDIEILDMDTTDPEEEKVLTDRLNTVCRYLKNLY